MAEDMPEVRLASQSDAEFHWHHSRRISLESGRDGDFIFSPNEDWDVSLDDYAKSYGEKLNKSVLETGWERTWVIADSNSIYGDLQLVHRPSLKTCLHRATLMMGIERTYRNNGYGSKLMSEALRWAKAQPSLEWLQLFVFEGNEPARKFYKKYGFSETGTVPDMFRVHGKQIADITMILKL